jgi:predicted PurR-regulated permease PerM
MGVLGVSTVDNLLRPMIIGNRTKMPFFAVFFSVLGGIKLFGLIGFILGPLVLAISSR